MKHFAHRGEIINENKVLNLVNVIKNNSKIGIELDVRFNTNRDIVLCHDREKRNDEDNELLEELFISLPSEFTNNKLLKDLFISLPSEFTKKDIIIDIKAFGIFEAKNIAKKICEICFKYNNIIKNYNLYLCSFNEYCVSELCFCRENYDNINWNIGVIASGVPIGLFNHLEDIDFVSLDYNIICEEIVENIKKNNIEIFAWIVNDESMQKMMKLYNIDGIIYDI